jgi:hypothetical protein
MIPVDFTRRLVVAARPSGPHPALAGTGRRSGLQQSRPFPVQQREPVPVLADPGGQRGANQADLAGGLTQLPETVLDLATDRQVGEDVVQPDIREPGEAAQLKLGGERRQRQIYIAQLGAEILLK